MDDKVYRVLQAFETTDRIVAKHTALSILVQPSDDIESIVAATSSQAAGNTHQLTGRIDDDTRLWQAFVQRLELTSPV